MSFLYVLARSYCLPLLPRLVRKVSKYALLVLIPVTIATNEFGSFIGINYRKYGPVYILPVLIAAIQGFWKTQANRRTSPSDSALPATRSCGFSSHRSRSSSSLLSKSSFSAFPSTWSFGCFSRVVGPHPRVGLA